MLWIEFVLEGFAIGDNRRQNGMVSHFEINPMLPIMKQIHFIIQADFIKESIHVPSVPGRKEPGLSY